MSEPNPVPRISDQSCPWSQPFRRSIPKGSDASGTGRERHAVWLHKGMGDRSCVCLRVWACMTRILVPVRVFASATYLSVSVSVSKSVSHLLGTVPSLETLSLSLSLPYSFPLPPPLLLRLQAEPRYFHRTIGSATTSPYSRRLDTRSPLIVCVVESTIPMIPSPPPHRASEILSDGLGRRPTGPGLEITTASAEPEPLAMLSVSHSVPSFGIRCST
ncbi:hypothetical protein BO70DRAFT_26549 [Aspergillus heteromorphus CBS 117.55]|uniref:Uncharacterized protein n=1 Tax=Aspergillus heteromorphus CBS 117.55 TaxID=1448321 RepID=A0A317WE09_9EURO|nr:uncharacterized protein BO70DRAFT_26549 [Aspergillus heteromorphus CBS 117.55]PWY83462.1 hypothetical protein BO70DRAFT_26549 [Aspergillus heteromorphus CBS 117.55]